MSRPTRMKLFVCRFMSKEGQDDYGGYRVRREITPILAQDANQAMHLVWRKHGQYFAEFFGPPLEWMPYPRFEKVSTKTRNFLQKHLEFVELPTREIWANGLGYVNEDIRTPV